MKICLAQTHPATGDIQRNIESHLNFVRAAQERGAALILFPELSLTAYEPGLAEELAVSPDDPRLAVFQAQSDQHGITIALGAPTIAGTSRCISLLIFQPKKDLLVYSKKYLHTDEEPFFISGHNFPLLDLGKEQAALAICYEISIPEHTEAAFANGATLYLASVVKFLKDMDRAGNRMAEIARSYRVPTLMTNSIGEADNGICGGGSAVWSSQGELVEQLPATDEGILIFDTDTGHCTTLLLPLRGAQKSQKT